MGTIIASRILESVRSDSLSNAAHPTDSTRVYEGCVDDQMSSAARGQILRDAIAVMLAGQAKDDPATRSITIAVPRDNKGAAIASLSTRLLPVIKDLRARWKVEVLGIDDEALNPDTSFYTKKRNAGPSV